MAYNSAGAFVDDLVKVVKDAATNKIESNKAINPISNFTGGIEAVGRLVGGEGATAALKNTFTDGAGKLKYGKIAGSYIGVAAAGRALSGGGVYKDGNGNTNLVGIPFV